MNTLHSTLYSIGFTDNCIGQWTPRTVMYNVLSCTVVQDSVYTVSLEQGTSVISSEWPSGEEDIIHWLCLTKAVWYCIIG